MPTSGEDFVHFVDICLTNVLLAFVDLAPTFVTLVNLRRLRAVDSNLSVLNHSMILAHGHFSFCNDQIGRGLLPYLMSSFIQACHGCQLALASPSLQEPLLRLK